MADPVTPDPIDVIARARHNADPWARMISFDQLDPETRDDFRESAQRDVAALTSAGLELNPAVDDDTRREVEALAERCLDEAVHLQRHAVGAGETVGLLSEAAVALQRCASLVLREGERQPCGHLVSEQTCFVGTSTPCCGVCGARIEV